jgi:hypothetical protein
MVKKVTEGGHTKYAPTGKGLAEPSKTSFASKPKESNPWKEEEKDYLAAHPGLLDRDDEKLLTEEEADYLHAHRGLLSDETSRALPTEGHIREFQQLMRRYGKR